MPDVQGQEDAGDAIMVDDLTITVEPPRIEVADRDDLIPRLGSCGIYCKRATQSATPTTRRMLPRIPIQYVIHQSMRLGMSINSSP